jgi:hypothetical protein
MIITYMDRREVLWRNSWVKKWLWRSTYETCSVLVTRLVTKWCELRDHVVTQPTIKIEIWFWKAEIGLIGVWHNRNLLQGITLLEWSRMMPQSQLIFDKSDSVRSRTEECKIHSHTLKLKNSEVIFINGSWNFGYMSLNSSRKINLNESTFVG